MAGNDNTPSNASTSKPNNIILEQMATKLTALCQQLTALTTKAAAKAVKPTIPSYDGSKGTFCGFLTQLRAFHLFYAHELPTDQDKVLYASNCLKGDALSWFEPTLRDYLENNGQPNKMDDDTRSIFQSLAKFEETLKSTFGDPDKELLKQVRGCCP